MGFQLAELFVTVGTKGEDRTFSTLDSIKASLLGIPAVGQVIGTVIGGVVDVLSDSAAEFGKNVAAVKQLDAVLAATGGVAGYTSQQLQGMADALEGASNFEAEDIMGGMSKLLTFKSVGGDEFERGLKASLDLAAAGFGSIEGNAVQLGKALENPVKGVAALSRSGVTFSDAEREKIKLLTESGRLIEAQQTVLAAIEGQVGGVAAATASPFTQLERQIGNIKEALGAGVLPVMSEVVDIISSILPEADSLKGQFAGIGETIAGWLDFAQPVVSAVATMFGEAIGLATDFASVIAADLAPMFGDLFANAASFRAAFVGTISVVTNWMQFLRANAGTIWELFGNSAAIALIAVRDGAANMWTDTIAGGAGFFAEMSSYLDSLVEVFKETFRKIVEMGGAAWEAIRIGWEQKSIGAAVDSFNASLGDVFDPTTIRSPGLSTIRERAAKAGKKAFDDAGGGDHTTSDDMEALQSMRRKLLAKLTDDVGRGGGGVTDDPRDPNYKRAESDVGGVFHEDPLGGSLAFSGIAEFAKKLQVGLGDDTARKAMEASQKTAKNTDKIDDVAGNTKRMAESLDKLGRIPAVFA